MQKSALQYGEIIFQSKVIPLFLPKCSKLHSFYIIMVYCIPYMEVTVGKKKKGKTWRNEVDTKNSKNSNFRDSYLNIEKEFHNSLIFYGRIPLSDPP